MKLLLGLLILVAAFGAVTWWRAVQNEARAEEHYPPRGAFIEVNGTRVHYLTEGEGPDVLLIHGASGNLRDFDFDLIGRLSDRYRVTAIDRPGLGYTGRLSHGASIHEQAALLADTAAALDIERPILVGHSYGGAVSLAWAVDRPDDLSGLVLLGAASNPWETGLSFYYRVLSHPLGQRFFAPILTAWVPERVVDDTIASVFTPQSEPDGYAPFIGAGLTLRRASLRENALQRASILEEIEELHTQYRTISVPTEILHGDADTTVWLTIHSEPLSRQINGANLVVMEGVGHMPHHAQPQTAVDAIDRVAERAGLR